MAGTGMRTDPTYGALPTKSARPTADWLTDDLLVVILRFDLNWMVSVRILYSMAAYHYLATVNVQRVLDRHSAWTEKIVIGGSVNAGQYTDFAWLLD